MHADGGDGLAADHHEAGDDDAGADGAARRQPLDAERRSHSSRPDERRGRRLDDAGVAERHQQKA